MKKLSKKDGPQQSNEEFWKWYSSRPVSNHFQPGTWILRGGRRGLVKDVVSDGTLAILWDDGDTVAPIALNR